MVSILAGFSGGFVEIFAKLAPEAAEHELGSCFASGIFLDQRGVEVNTFSLFVLPHILSFVYKGMTAQEGYPADSVLIFSQLLT